MVGHLSERIILMNWKERTALLQDIGWMTLNLLDLERADEL